MTAGADLLLTNAEVYTHCDPDAAVEAVAIRGGSIVRTGSAYDVEFLDGIDTRVIDLDGRVLLPGFIDAHTHLEMTGRYLVHADLRGADRSECLDRLRRAADGDWILGYGFDESTWADPDPLTRDELDDVNDSRPVVAFREDMHVAAVNSVVLDRYAEKMPDDDVHRTAGRPTGVVIEGAVDVLFEATAPDRSTTHDLLLAAQTHAVSRGVTGVHEKLRRSHAPVVYRDLDLAGDLDLRVRLDYWADHLDSVLETGLRSNHGSGMVRVGAIKTYTDGSIGGRTARLSEAYADGDGRGQWVVTPEELRELVRRADGAGLQVAAHAIGDAAIEVTLDAYENTAAGAARHRIEHAELTTDAHIERAADLGIVASVQPNFLKWARPGGLYDARLGERRTTTNRFRDLLDAGVHLAFGSDGMPLDPLFGIHQTVNAPAEAQTLSVSEALRAYSAGGAYAGFDEHRLGAIEVGNRADLVALDRSPWARPDAIKDIAVALTVVDGRVVFDGRVA